MEPDVRPFLQAWLAAGKELALPRLQSDAPEIEFRRVGALDEMRPGLLSVPEPDAGVCPVCPLESTDVIFGPGQGFSEEGWRLGRGGGHYDRLLARLPERAVRIGCFFACQEVVGLEGLREGHDRCVGWVVTEKGVQQSFG